MATGARGARAPISLRLERSPVVQVLISALVLLVLLAEVGVHLPSGSKVQQAVGPEANHISRLLGTEQQWGVFAPDPRQTSLGIEGRVTFADGSTTVWTLPEGPRLGANLRYYRWRKWLEPVRSDDYRGIWEATARWIASEHAGGPVPVASVTLVRRFRQNRIHGPQPPYEEFSYYTYVMSDEDGG